MVDYDARLGEARRFGKIFGAPYKIFDWMFSRLQGFSARGHQMGYFTALPPEVHER
jgi:hypothetical protein